jgi:penicillin-binding protein 2
MKFVDGGQNVRARLVTIQVLLLAMLAVLGVRLYTLQIAKGAYYAEKAENQRIRFLNIPAPRGVIFDRNGVLLVDSRPIYNVILSREDMKKRAFSEFIAPLSQGLEVDPDFLRQRFDEVKALAAFESIRVKENANANDIAWVEAHKFEFPELRVELQPQRRYPENNLLAHVLGYVGEISPKQLTLPEYQQKGFRPGDIIGQEGLEAYYDDYLRGRDGYRKVVVDSRGRVIEEIEKADPQPGQDLYITIDVNMQRAAEEQLQKSPNKRGVIVAVDPNNGEVLTMASAPTFDPNLFAQRIATKEGRAEYAALATDPMTPLYNRAIKGRYPCGSTWKIPLAVAGLQQGVITEESNAVYCGGGITIGAKFTRCMGSHGTPPLKYAITKSCDGYFYRLGLKMGIDGIMRMVDEFDINRRSGVDLPHELISRTPNFYKPRWDKSGRPWLDINTVYASIGQDTVVVTPLALVRAIAAISVRKMYVPHLLKEFREVAAVGEPGSTTYREIRPRRIFTQGEPKLIPMTEEQHKIVTQGMLGVVQGGGTAGGQGISGFEVAAKTGTAQVAALGKDSGARKDHSWFVAFAPASKPEIAIVTLIENAGFGGKFAAPASRNVLLSYIEHERARLQGWNEQQVAENGGNANSNANANGGNVNANTNNNASANSGSPATNAAPNTKGESNFQHTGRRAGAR